MGRASWQAEAEQHPYLDYLYNSVGKNHFIPGTEGLVRDWTEQDLRQIAATYYGMCTEVDDQVGRVMSLLEVNGEMENTIVVFTSDHGEQMGDHHLLGKYGFFDQSYHVPLVIVDGRNERSSGRQVEAFSESIDLMPTLLALVDSEVPPHLDGHSLAGFLSTGDPTDDVDHSSSYHRQGWRDAVHWEYDFRDVVRQQAEQTFGIHSRACNLSVMRNQRYKYVHFAALPPLLFDISEDPGETRNLAEEADYQSVARSCAEELLSWRATHLDQSLALSQLNQKGYYPAGSTR